MAMDAELERLHRRAVTFAAFVRATRRDWSRLAAWLLRSWEVPAGVGVEDVEQELHLAAWKSAAAYQEGRGGMSFADYVIWCACADAKKFIHRQRNAARRHGDAPGRFELPLSALERDGEEGGTRHTWRGRELPEPRVEPRQEDLALADERAAAVQAELPWVEAQTFGHVLRVLAGGGDLAQAARVVYWDPKLSLHARIGSAKDARRLVGRVVEAANGVLEQATDGGERAEEERS